LSRQALTLAAGISACFEASLTVFHVKEPSGANPVADLCSWVPQAERARCDIRELVRHGDASEEIVRLAAEGPYDLVVMGAPRRRFFDGMVMGTTTLRTARHAFCPVMTLSSEKE